MLDIDLLMVIAAATAAAVGAPFEGAVLLTLFSISTTLEHRAMARARNAVEALMTLRPDTALRERADGIVEEVKAAELCPGDIVVLRPGARVPADSIVFDGEGSMDEATITGESMPVHKSPGSKVFEATVNQNSVLRIKVEHRVAESTVARMIALVTEAQAARAPSERFSDWFGQRYTIGVLAGAVLAFVSFTGLAGLRAMRSIGLRPCWLLQAHVPLSSRCPPPFCRHLRFARAAAFCSRAARRWKCSRRSIFLHSTRRER
ncbi:hypothetical protein M798_05065 [Brucella melitensis ADMAS-G1]|nr:hypothetical protein M798_05065 [Brucella melitensis ADMAS-G1]